MDFTAKQKGDDRDGKQVHCSHARYHDESVMHSSPKIKLSIGVTIVPVKLLDSTWDDLIFSPGGFHFISSQPGRSPL